jgi:hypothetical protein
MEVAIIIELLKVISGVVMEVARQNGMSDEEILAYQKQLDDAFMALPSANELPLPPEPK